MNFVEYADREMLMIDLANQLAGELNECLMTHERASFAVPGGTTPGPVFDTLSAVDLHWERVHVFPTDERWVDESSERSNARLIKNRLLTGKAAKATFVPFYRDGDQAEALDALASEVRKELPISVLLLGMGADMHTASLFPNAPELEDALYDTDTPVKFVQPADQELRVTLSGPALAGAMSTHILIHGEEKLEALDRATGLDAHEAPINTVLANANIHWAP